MSRFARYATSLILSQMALKIAVQNSNRKTSSNKRFTSENYDKITFYVPKGELKTIKEYAKSLGISVNKLLQTALEKYRKNIEGNRMRVYYHVSSYLKEGQKIKYRTKNNYEFCELICSVDILSFEKYLKLLSILDEKCVFINTGRDKYKWSCEYIFEAIRKKYYNHFPSRVWGIYLSESLEKAISFNQKYRQGRSKIFEISPSNNVYKFDMDIFTKADESLREKPDITNYNNAINLAHEYWKKTINNPDTTEYLLEQEEIIIGELVYPKD